MDEAKQRSERDRLIVPDATYNAVRDFAARSEHVVVKEEVWKRHSKAVLDFASGIETDVGAWFTQLNSAYLPAHVVNNRGELLFIVPPILERIASDNTKYLDTLGTVAAKARQIAPFNPIGASNLVNRRINAVRVPTVSDKNIPLWNTLLKLHGREPFGLVAEHAASTQPVSLDMDDSEYL